MSALSDDSSLASSARDAPQAFATLYDRYVARIYAYALRQTGDMVLAQDVTSATFEKALRHLRRKGWQSGSFLAWLYRIARNETVHQYRKGDRMVDLSDRLSVTGEQESILEADQDKHHLREAFSRLSAHDQEVLNLRFFEALSSSEVAEVLGYTLPNLYLQVHRALQRLRKELEVENAVE